MKYCLLSLLALMVCSGPSCLQPFDRLAVNDELRATCQGMPDSQILGRIEQAEAERLSGASKGAALAHFFAGCINQLCYDCWTAVIDQVYDNAP